MKKSRLILVGLMTASLAACATAPGLSSDQRAPRSDVQRDIPSIAFPVASGPSYENFVENKTGKTSDAFGRNEMRPGNVDTE